MAASVKRTVCGYRCRSLIGSRQWSNAELAGGYHDDFTLMVTKRNIRGQFITALSFFLLFFLLLRPAPTKAQEPQILGGVAPAPVSGAGAVQFVSQAVDATLSRAADGSYIVSNEAAIRLNNTNRFGAASVTLGFPGWGGGNVRFNPAELPGFAPYTDNGALGTQFQSLPTTFFGASQESTWQVTTINIPADTRVRFYTDWQQSLGAGPLLTYSFGLIPASAWEGTMGSARITLNLPFVVSEEAVVAATPTDGEDTYTFLGDTIEWLLIDTEPSVNPTVTLIAPDFWREIENTRAARATDPLGANIRLADLYAQLAAAGVSSYSLEAEGALEAARRAAPNDPVPLQRLAVLYRQRADQNGGDLAILEQSVTVAEEALAAGSTDAETRAALLRDLQILADAWTTQDPLIALDFLTRAEVVAGGSDPAITEKRRVLAEQLAVTALQEGQTEYALELAVAQGLTTDTPPLPYLESAALHILNRATERTYTLTVTGNPAVLEETLGGLATRLTTAGFPATWDAATATFSVTTPGTADTWQAAGQTVALAIGNDLELALLRDALLPPSVRYENSATWWAEEHQYRETLQLGARTADHAHQLRSEADQRASAWEQALIRAVATDWDAFAQRQSVRITTQFAEGADELQREWNVNLPTAQVLEWQERTTNRDNLMLLAAGVAGGLFLLLGLIWLPGRR